MPPQIVFNQLGKPPGVAGFAREDLALGVTVVASVQGGPFLAQAWSFLDKPIDHSIPAQSAAAIQTPLLATTNILPIDRQGTYLLRCVVDQGFGLGARDEDIAELSFYAGETLSSSYDMLPRRVIAFLERAQHNPQSDPIFGVLGNLRGWAQEMDRWFAVIRRIRTDLDASRLFAHSRFKYTMSGIQRSTERNIANIARTGVGLYTVTFTTAASNGLYIVQPTPFDSIGFVNIPEADCAAGSFKLERYDDSGTLADLPCCFSVIR